MEKKDKILAAALDLFANEGYNATSTSKIAKHAGVSEGLIFRHFESKKGLLDALTAEAQTQLEQIMAPLLFEQEPKVVIKRMIELPYAVPRSAYDFWRLQFKLKWQAEYHNPEKMKPVLEKVSWAFAELGYNAPEKEAEVLGLIMESVSIGLMRGDITEPDAQKQFLLSKYQV